MKAQPVKSCERIGNIRSLKRKREDWKNETQKSREDRLVKPERRTGRNTGKRESK